MRALQRSRRARWTRLIDREVSIGDYVLTGGEPAALVLIDAVVRLGYQECWAILARRSRILSKMHSSTAPGIQDLLNSTENPFRRCCKAAITNACSSGVASRLCAKRLSVVPISWTRQIWTITKRNNSPNGNVKGWNKPLKLEGIQWTQASCAKLTSDQLKTDLPNFSAGDTLRIHVRVIEGDKERIQVFEGTAIQRKGKWHTRDHHRAQDNPRRCNRTYLSPAFSAHCRD